MKKNIEENIKALTDDQKKLILFIYKIRLAITVVIFGIMAIFMVYCHDIFSDFTIDPQYSGTLFKIFIAVTVISFATVGGTYLYIKIKYPFFSKKKYEYLKNSTQSEETEETPEIENETENVPQDDEQTESKEVDEEIKVCD